MIRASRRPRGYSSGMSGIFCEGCGEGNLVADPHGSGKRPVTCDLCGWTADAGDLSRKWRDDDGPPWTKRDRKMSGRLFFLWIDLDSNDDTAAYAIVRILNLSGMNVASRVLIELEKEPSAS